MKGGFARVVSAAKRERYQACNASHIQDASVLGLGQQREELLNHCHRAKDVGLEHLSRHNQVFLDP
jgi:hypothetical protein